MDFLECKVCHVPYDEEDHRPRHAPCGHEYCSACIKALIKDNIFECPKCRQKNKVDDAEDMPVNFGLIDVVRAFKTKSIPLAKETESRSSGATNEEVCNMHGKSISHWCLKCQLWLCHGCLEHHTSLLGCSTAVETKAIEGMKETNSKDTDVLLTIFEEDTKFVSSKIKELNDKRKEIADKRQELLERFEKYGEKVDMLTGVLEQGNLQKENVIEAKRDLNAADSRHTVTDRLKDLTQRKQMLRTWSVKNIGTALLDLLKAFEEENGVYAEMVIDDEKRHAKLSKHDGNIDVHPFLKQTVSNGSVFMPFDRLAKMIPEAPLVYIELTLSGTVKGKVHIRLDKKLPNTRNYVVQIVTGQRGASLKGIALPGRDNRGLYRSSLMLSQGSSNMSGLFYNSTIGGFSTPDTSGTSIAKRGDVPGYFGNSYLNDIYFHVAKQPPTYDHGNDYLVFGQVEAGMDVIQECYDNRSNGVAISDCGLIIEQE